VEGQVTTRIFHSESLSGDGEGLARTSSDDEIGFSVPFIPISLYHISKIRDIGIMMRENLVWELFDFGERHRFPTEVFPRHGDRINAGEQRYIFHTSLLRGVLSRVVGHEDAVVTWAITLHSTPRLADVFCALFREERER
jgi:hypothetical protein